MEHRHMGFQLVLISVTLNDLERSYGPYFSLFHQILIGLEANT